MRVKRLRLQIASFVLTAALAVGCSGALPQATVAPTTALLFLHEGAIYEIDGEFAEPVGRPGDEPFLTASGMVSSIREGRTIQIHRYEGEGGLALVREITLPERVVATVDGSSDRIVLKESRAWTTALADGVLYVTGELGDHTLGLYDLDRSEPPFEPMQVPREVGPPKAFDELLVDGDSLLAVDDIEYPKWLVIYDISRPRAPKRAKAVELPSGIYKRIHRGVVGPRYLALWCSEGGKYGDSDYVELYDKAEGFTFSGAVTLWARELRVTLPADKPGKDAVPEWGEIGSSVEELEMSFLGEDLLLSPWGDGVGVVHTLRPLPPMPDQLLYTGPDGKAVAVHAAAALAVGDKAVVWLEDGVDRGLVVSHTSLSSRPYTPD